MMTDRTIIRTTPPLCGEKIHQHLDRLVSMGPRWPSTPAERFSATYMEENMRTCADEVVSEPFEYPLYVPLEAEIEVVSDGGKPCTALGVQYSANGECEGELVYIEGGEGADLRAPGPMLEHKILLVKTRRPYALAVRSEGTGIKAIIVISESPENTIRPMIAKTGYVQGADPEEHRASIPMIAVGARSGEYLQELCRGREVKVRLVHRSLQVIRRSRNVVGKIFGKTGKSVIIGAHYDTQMNVPGAWDNAAGCALLLDVMRAARSLNAMHNMEFAAFGCEEPGILGSTRYVELRKNELRKIICYFNLDSVSSIASTTLEVHTTPGLEHFVADVLEGVCALKPTSYNFFGPLNVAQDSAPFFGNGVNAIWVHEEGNPYFHTPQDTREKVDIQRLVDVGGAIFKMFVYLSMGGVV